MIKNTKKIIIDVSHGFRHLPILATKFYNKKYFLPVLALLFEGVRSYVVLKMSKNEEVLKIIKNLRENSKKKDDYQIRDMCMKAVSPTTNPKKASIINKDLKAKLGRKYGFVYKSG